MDHNGFYSDLNSSNNFSSGSLNASNFDSNPVTTNSKYQPSIYPSAIYPQSQQSQQLPSGQQPQTQININNCNNNIFFPPDDGFESSSATNLSTSNTSASQKLGYGRKVDSTGGNENITYNINNINTNIVNNINSATNHASGTDFFGGSQYQVNKSGDTIINFNSNNLNSSNMASNAAAAGAPYYYQGSSQQQTSFESTTSQVQKNNIFSELPNGPVISAKGTENQYLHSHRQNPSSATSNPTYLAGNSTTLNSNPAPTFGGYHDPLSPAAKIINSFVSKNPIKYPISNQAAPQAAASCYKNEYPTGQYQTAGHQYHHLQPGMNYYPHLPTQMHDPLQSGQSSVNKVTTISNPQYNYDPYQQRMAPRSVLPSHYTGHHYSPYPAHSIPIDENSNRIGYSRSQHSAYHHSSHPMPNQYQYMYGTNGLNHRYHNRPVQVQPLAPAHRSSSSTNRNPTPESYPNMHVRPKYARAITGQSMQIPESNYPTYQSQPPPADAMNYYSPYYLDDPLNACKKPSITSNRPKAASEVYNTSNNGTYEQHPSLLGNAGGALRNMSAAYQQPTPKIYGSSHPQPSHNSSPLGTYDLPTYHYSYEQAPVPNYSCSVIKANDQAKAASTAYQNGVPINPVMNNSKQFKNYNVYDLPDRATGYHLDSTSQLHTLQPALKYPEKVKLSIDLEEQITGSKIPKNREIYAYPHYDYKYPHYPYYHHYHQHLQTRMTTEDKVPSVRDFFSTWNDEIDDDDTERSQHPAIVEDIERSIIREYNPMFSQKQKEQSVIVTNDQANNLPDVVIDIDVEKHKSIGEANAVNDTSLEKLYVLETINVPISEIGKYQHLNVINRLPENIVPMSDKELYVEGGVENSLKFLEEIESNREKYYKNDLELDVIEAQEEEKKLNKKKLEREASTDKKELKAEEKLSKAARKKSASEALKSERIKKKKLEKELKEAEDDSTIKKKRLKMLVQNPAKPVAPTAEQHKLKITKKYRKYSLQQKPTSNIKTLKLICIDFCNTSAYRNYARECLTISKKCSKMMIMKNFKQKLNIQEVKRTLRSSNKFGSLHDIISKTNYTGKLNMKAKQISQDATVLPKQFEKLPLNSIESEVSETETIETEINRLDDLEALHESEPDSPLPEIESIENFDDVFLEEPSIPPSPVDVFLDDYTSINITDIVGANIDDEGMKEETIQKKPESKQIIKDIGKTDSFENECLQQDNIESAIDQTVERQSTLQEENYSEESFPGSLEDEVFEKNHVKNFINNETDRVPSPKESFEIIKKKKQKSIIETSEPTLEPYINEIASPDASFESDVNKVEPDEYIQDNDTLFRLQAEEPQIVEANPILQTLGNDPIAYETLETFLLGDQEDDEDYQLENEVDHCSEPAMILHEVLTLKEMCKMVLATMDVNVVESEEEYIYNPFSLRDLCENFIYLNRQYYIIEEVPAMPELSEEEITTLDSDEASRVPRLQEICKQVLSETNIFIKVDDANKDICYVEESETIQVVERVLIENGNDLCVLDPTEEQPGFISELFASPEHSTVFDKTADLLNKIQSADIDEHDEIFKEIAEMHRESTPEVNNNNDDYVANKNIISMEQPEVLSHEFDSEMSFMTYGNDDMMHNIQYEEIIPVNDVSCKRKNLFKSLQYKYLNRANYKTIHSKIGKKYKQQKYFQHEGKIFLKRRVKFEQKANTKKLFLKSEVAPVCSYSKEIVSPVSIKNENLESQTVAKENGCTDDRQSCPPNIKPNNPQPQTNLDSLENRLKIGPKTPDVPCPNENNSSNDTSVDELPKHSVRTMQNLRLRKRKLSFDDTLISINRIYSKAAVNRNNEAKRAESRLGDHRERLEKSDSKRYGSRSHDKHSKTTNNSSKSRENSRTHSRSHTTSSNNHYSEHSSRNSSSSYQGYWRSSSDPTTPTSNGQQHSLKYQEYQSPGVARRLIIPKYKQYDKDLDIKLKVLPYVKLPRIGYIDKLGSLYYLDNLNRMNIRINDFNDDSADSQYENCTDTVNVL